MRPGKRRLLNALAITPLPKTRSKIYLKSRQTMLMKSERTLNEIFVALDNDCSLAESATVMPSLHWSDGTLDYRIVCSYLCERNLANFAKLCTSCTFIKIGEANDLLLALWHASSFLGIVSQTLQSCTRGDFFQIYSLTYFKRAKSSQRGHSRVTWPKVLSSVNPFKMKKSPLF